MTESLSLLVILLIVAAVVEALWESLKPVFGTFPAKLDERGVPSDRLGALLMALLVCLAIGSQADLFVLLGLPLRIPVLGIVLTAILLARGSNFVHDFFAKLDATRKGKKLELEYLNNNIDAGM